MRSDRVVIHLLEFEPRTWGIKHRGMGGLDPVERAVGSRIERPAVLVRGMGADRDAALRVDLSRDVGDRAAPRHRSIETNRGDVKPDPGDFVTGQHQHPGRTGRPAERPRETPGVHRVVIRQPDDVETAALGFVGDVPGRQRAIARKAVHVEVAGEHDISTARRRRTSGRLVTGRAERETGREEHPGCGADAAPAHLITCNTRGQRATAAPKIDTNSPQVSAWCTSVRTAARRPSKPSTCRKNAAMMRGVSAIGTSAASQTGLKGWPMSIAPHTAANSTQSDHGACDAKNRSSVRARPTLAAAAPGMTASAIATCSITTKLHVKVVLSTSDGVTCRVEDSAMPAPSTTAATIGRRNAATAPISAGARTSAAYVVSGATISRIS